MLIFPSVISNVILDQSILQVNEAAFKTLVHPQLKHGSDVWSPYTYYTV